MNPRKIAHPRLNIARQRDIYYQELSLVRLVRATASFLSDRLTRSVAAQRRCRSE
jgi:hypothetical protein